MAQLKTMLDLDPLAISNNTGPLIAAKLEKAMKEKEPAKKKRGAML